MARKVKYRPMFKADLAARLPCSRTTFWRYLKSFSSQIPNYNPNQKMLTGDQVEAICEHFCIDLDEDWE